MTSPDAARTPSALQPPAGDGHAGGSASSLGNDPPAAPKTLRVAETLIALRQNQEACMRLGLVTAANVVAQAIKVIEEQDRALAFWKMAEQAKFAALCEAVDRAQELASELRGRKTEYTSSPHDRHLFLHRRAFSEANK